MRGSEFSGAPQRIPALRCPAGQGGADYSDPGAGPCTLQGPVFPPAFTVPTVFFATGSYFWGQLNVYHTPDHAFIADKHDPAYHKHLIDSGSKRQSQKIRSAPQIQVGTLRLCPAPFPMQGRAGPNLRARPRMRCGAGSKIFTPPRPKVNTICGPQKIPAQHHTAGLGGGSFFFSLYPMPRLGPCTFGALFLLPPANSPLLGPVFWGAPSGAPLIVVNFVPEMRISGIC